MARATERLGGLFFIFCVFACSFCVSGQSGASFGRVYLQEVFVKTSAFSILRSSTPKLTFQLICSTPASATKTVLEDIKVGQMKSYEEPRDTKIELLSFEDMECELKEIFSNSENGVLSHGLCGYPYRRFLSSRDNSVECQLSSGSFFRLQMRCPGGCPEAAPPPNKPFCAGMKTLPPANFGVMNSFGDGSPGFGLYAPTTVCGWRIPRSTKGVTNFLFTRFDLAPGDNVTVFSSNDGVSKDIVKVYTQNTPPDSISLDAPFMIVEFRSDDKEEGLGFYGFYFDTFEIKKPVSVIPSPVVAEGETDSSKFLIGSVRAIPGESEEADGIKLKTDEEALTEETTGGLTLVKTPADPLADAKKEDERKTGPTKEEQNGDGGQGKESKATEEPAKEEENGDGQSKEGKGSGSKTEPAKEENGSKSKEEDSKKKSSDKETKKG